MDEKKFCIIMCVNDKHFEQEAITYINRLRIPEGYDIDCLSIWEAASMAAGYNEGMKTSDAKYKIYMHQDVFIINRDFLYRLLEIFSNPAVGMVGCIGTPKMPANGIMWYGKRIGQIFAHNVYHTLDSGFLDIVRSPYQPVEAIDGLLMATQYDIPWREDLFKHWDFYDASQSFEFIRAGYEVVVPYMEQPWVIHDEGFMKLKTYYEDRKLFVKEYL
ncbi:MAG: glycosyltransferase family protein [Lachnospiraceae bacterium]|nr:glycosyltransferase family protein [Lachnospiraceae bacterium]